jgi:GNAT superfamily N-acetyltransferase
MNIKEIALDTKLSKKGAASAIPKTQMKNAWSWVNPTKDKFVTSKILPNFRIYFNTVSPERKRVFLVDPTDLKLPAAEVVLLKYGKGWISAATQVLDKYQGQGLGLKLYEALIKDFGMMLISDDNQSWGGAGLWKRLFSVPGILVYAYNPRAKDDKYKYVQVDSQDDAKHLEADYGDDLYGDKKGDQKAMRLIAIKK